MQRREHIRWLSLLHTYISAIPFEVSNPNMRYLNVIIYANIEAHPEKNHPRPYKKKERKKSHACVRTFLIEVNFAFDAGHSHKQAAIFFCHKKVPKKWCTTTATPRTYTWKLFKNHSVWLRSCACAHVYSSPPHFFFAVSRVYTNMHETVCDAEIVP